MQTSSELKALIKALLGAFSRTSCMLRSSLEGGKFTHTENTFGDKQLETDVLSELIINEELEKSGLVAFSANEENPQMKPLSEHGQFIVTFDPLDGSSIIGTNFTVGTIVGVWPRDDEKLLHKTGNHLVSALCCLYGSRTSVLLYEDEKVREYTLYDSDKKGHWELTKDDIRLKKSGRIFSPGNLRSINDHKAYKEVLEHWFHTGYTLRYSGGMAPDICQILLKQEGVFSTFGTAKNPSKLRYLYECAPLAFLIEKAGGSSFDGKGSVLQAEIVSYEQKCELVLGCEDEVELVKKSWQKHGLL